MNYDPGVYLIKKICIAVTSVFFSFAAYAQVPVLLRGVWKNSERYTVFDTNYYSEKNGGAVPQSALRLYYQFYLDRVAESSDYSEKNRRPVNAATQKDPAEEISMEFIPLTDEALEPSSSGQKYTAENVPSGAWNLKITYPGYKEPYYIPVAVIGDKLYLKFKIKEDDSDKIPYSPLLDGTVMQSGNIMAGFWKDFGTAEKIPVSRPRTKTELLSYYVTDNAVYHIRYWQTDMDYDAETQAVFSDGEDTFYVPKHLNVSGKTYTCVTGKRTRIRNIEKSAKIPEEYSCNTVLVKKSVEDQDGKNTDYMVRIATICVLGEPYMVLQKGMSMEQILEESKKLHAPAPKPLFPPHGILDFDWSIVERPPKNWNKRMLDLGK